MINKNHTSEIRTCERIKFDQALYILTMYEKKIRKNRQHMYKQSHQDKGVDADEQLQDITYAWKNKWKMDLTKPVLNCVTSVYPRILVDFGVQVDERLEGFYRRVGQFVRRMRAEHEDETNYKFVLNNYDRNTMVDEESERREEMNGDEEEKSYNEKLKMLNCAKASVNSILNVAYNMSQNCIKHFEQNFEYIINEDISDVDTEGLEWQVIRPLRYIREITRRAIYGSGEGEMVDQEEQWRPKLQPESQEASQLGVFVHNLMRIMERIKQSQHGSTLITIQPEIKELTYVIHPLLVAVYATFKKENLEKQKDFDWHSVPVESKTFMENVKNSYNFSKIVMINLDGYESEFNLQLARNFKKHLMYISFPKEQAILTDLQKVYSKRFFKKLMFRYTQACYQSYPTESLSQDLKHIAKLQQLNYNPENYHYFVEQMYQQHTDRPPEDFNQNMYIFPIRYKALKQHFAELFSETQKQDIEIYESYFIRFVMKDFLVNQIREFNPSYVMISYSGRVGIEDAHFVELIQEITKVANYKLLFFPNLTTAFCHEDRMQTDDLDGNECDYDNAVVDKNIVRLLGSARGSGQCQDEVEEGDKMEEEDDSSHKPMNEHPEESTAILELFNKVARFLKVSSGTYNLTRSNEEDSLISKFKNQFILAYTDEIMTTLGKEYFSIDRIRFKNKDLTIIPKLFEENLNAIKKSFTKTVPEFYVDLYKVLQVMLFNRDKRTAEDEELLNAYKVKLGEYSEETGELWEELTKSSSIQIVSYQKMQSERQQDLSQMRMEGDSKGEKKELMEQIEEIKIRKNRQKFMALRELHFIQISSEKYQQKASVYIKKKPEAKEFTQISEQSEQTQGLYDVSFLRKDRTQLKLFESTKVLYKSDQQHRSTNTIPVLIMNNLSDDKPAYFENYLAELDVSDEENKERKNIEERKALAVPLVIKEEQVSLQMKSMVVKSEWNFHETQEYIVLFWPTEFDFLRATIYKMLNKTYSPSISSSIYVSKKSAQKHIFRRVPSTVSRTTVLPRMGCSSYQFESRLFIFGGFYDKERNYLNFQHDISVFDLQTYAVSNGEKMEVENLKGVLYSEDNFRAQVEQRNSYNSFIRPKIQFEIFDKSQLAEWTEDSPTSKDVILFGGYGQNFLRPYSMLTYYFYELKFSYQTRKILSINKKIIYDKTVPINVKEMTKNLGLIKTNKKNPNTNVLETNKITEPGSYLTFRNSFKIQKNADNVEDFKYKTRYMFAEDQYKSYKTEIKKVQEQRTEEFDSSTISVQKMEGNNHLISLEKDGKKCVISLHLQIPHQKAKKLGCSREVKLTHESIVYIDFWNSMICAIVRHEFYTKGKSVLVEYNIKSLENLSFNHDEIPHIALTWIKEFQVNLSLHILIACNKNTIAILHGQKLLNSDKVKEFIVKKKKNKTEAVAYEIQERSIIDLAQSKFEYCYSVFFKQRNKILCLQYLSDHRNAVVIQIAHEIQLNSANDVYVWQAPAEKSKQQKSQSSNSKGRAITHYRIVHPQTQVSLPLHKLTIVQYLKIQREQADPANQGKKAIERMIEVEYSKKTYFLELGGLGTTEKGVLEMMPGDKVKIEKENIERGTILSKNVEQYYEVC